MCEANAISRPCIRYRHEKHHLNLKHGPINPYILIPIINIIFIIFFLFLIYLQRGSDELLSQAAVMAPASDNNNQDLATKKAKLDSTNSVIGGVGKFRYSFFSLLNIFSYFTFILRPTEMGERVPAS